ncbi:aminomethyltransferase beta-barrel domain-containing protein, partial [Acinetobacter baumannii]
SAKGDDKFITTDYLQQCRQDTPVKVTQNENGYIFEFSAPQWAPAVGQSLVLFQENECLGGGVISEIH